MYPEHKWDPLRFGKVPNAYWSSPLHLQEFGMKMERELGLQSKEDWDIVTAKSVIALGGSGLLKRYKTMKNLLFHIVPEHQMPRRMRHRGNRTERQLYPLHT